MRRATSPVAWRLVTGSRWLPDSLPARVPEVDALTSWLLRMASWCRACACSVAQQVPSSSSSIRFCVEFAGEAIHQDLVVKRSVVPPAFAQATGLPETGLGVGP